MRLIPMTERQPLRKLGCGKDQAEKMAAQMKAQEKAVAAAGGGASTSTFLPSTGKKKKNVRKGSREDSVFNGTVPQTGDRFGLSGNGFASTPTDGENLNPLVILEKNRKRMSALRLYIAELEGRILMQNSSSGSGEVKEISNVLPPIHMTDGAGVGAFESSEFSDSLDLLSPSAKINDGPPLAK